MKDIFEAAALYLSKGFRIFPVNGIIDGKCTCGKSDCGSAGKHPVTKNGLLDSVDNLESFKAITPKNANIAICTGATSGFWVLDVDGPEGIASLGALENMHGILTRTPAQSTGKGLHILFKHPGKKVVNRVKSLGAGLDVRGDGGYIVAAPSQHLLGHKYQWHDGALEDAPKWLVDLVVEQTKPDYVAPTNTYAPTTSSDVQSALARLNPSMTYDEWIKVGMALSHQGEPMSTWENWSRGGSNYKPNCCRPHWKSFKSNTNPITIATLFDMAINEGWVAPPPPVDNTPNPAQAFIDKIHSKKEASKSSNIVPPMPDIDITTLPPLIADTVRWLTNRALKPQPFLALIITLTALGAMYGRRYQNSTGIRTNIYTVTVGPTGCGKDAARIAIKNLITLSGSQDILGGDKIRSAEGLATMLEKFPRRIVLLDEMGMFLKTIGHNNAAGYERKISSALTEFYSAAQGTYGGGHYADKEKEVPILMAPHLCVYGTTTLESYVDALKREAIASGELNRYMMISAIDRPARNRQATTSTPPNALIKQWGDLKSSILKHGPSLADTITVLPNPPIVVDAPDATEEIWRMFDVQEDKLDNLGMDYGQLWQRFAENATKIAMIIAITRSQQQPVMFLEDYAIGERIARASCEYASHIAKNHMYSGELERNLNRVLERIRQSPGIKRANLGQYAKDFNLDAKSLTNIITTLYENGQILIENKDTSGRTAQTYRIRELDS